MSDVEYRVISYMKKSDKGEVCLAAVDWMDFPVVVKKIACGNAAVYRAVQKMESEFFPKIYHVRDNEDGIVLIEEYIEGECLSEYLKAETFDEDKWLDIATQLCDALMDLHINKPPIIHRDIKPSNIIINSKGRVKIVDLDSARFYKDNADGDTRLLGTQSYAAPEQYGFSQTDCRSDIYSLGAVLNEIPDFKEKTRQKRWKKLVERCTRFAPDSRFQTVSEVKSEIEKIKNVRRTKILIGAMVCCAAILVCTLGVVLITRNNGDSKESLAENVGQTSETEKGTELETTTTQTESTSEVAAAQDEENASKEPETQETETANTEPKEDGEPDYHFLITSSNSAYPEIATSEDQYKMIPPENRDVATDSTEIVELKEKIRENGCYVLHCFKDRLNGREYIYHLQTLEENRSNLQSIRLYSYMDDEYSWLDMNDVDYRDGMICISNEKIQSLKDGYYCVDIKSRTIDGYKIWVTTFLYVAESDEYEETVNWLQCANFTYYPGKTQELHLAVREDSNDKIGYLTTLEGTKIDDSLYSISEDGRIAEISAEFFEQNMGEEYLYFYAVAESGNTYCIEVGYSDNL